MQQWTNCKVHCVDKTKLRCKFVFLTFFGFGNYRVVVPKVGTTAVTHTKRRQSIAFL
jgi:hypothetical protein